MCGTCDENVALRVCVEETRVMRGYAGRPCLRNQPFQQGESARIGVERNLSQVNETVGICRTARELERYRHKLLKVTD